MSAHLSVFKDTGELLFDTTKIAYGLVKSGHMVFIERWGRYFLRSAQLNPNQGGNWRQSTSGSGDKLHGFSVANCRSPIVFIVGKGCLNGSARWGDTMTFHYCNADENTRYYVFDLMADNIAGGPYLKTYTPEGVLTFNSLQAPLNVVAAIQAPGPAAIDNFGRYISPYINGVSTKISVDNIAAGTPASIHNVASVPLAPGVEYAAFLPWARSCAVFDAYAGPTTYGMSEGAFGQVGGVSFMFGPAAATAQSQAPPGIRAPVSYASLPVDRFPTALVIRTAGLPFPFG